MKKLFISIVLIYASYGYTAAKPNKALKVKKEYKALIRFFTMKPNDVLRHTKKKMPKGTKRKFGLLVHCILEERHLRNIQNKYTVLEKEAVNKQCTGLINLKNKQVKIEEEIERTKTKLAKIQKK